MKKINEYISVHDDDFIMKINVSQDEIIKSQSQLGFKFDYDYNYYLSEYGLLSYESLETMGLGVPSTSSLNVVTATLEAAKAWPNFPSGAVVFEDIGEGNFVVYIMNKGVYQFSPSSLDLITNTIEEYLLLRFSEVSY